MKILPIILVVLSGATFADSYVSPHMRSDGTYVQGHMRSDPNGSSYDNYSTKGNSNPYTGERGDKEPSYGSSSRYDSDSSSRSGFGSYGNSYGSRNR